LQATMLRAIAAAEGLTEKDLVKLALNVNNPNPDEPRNEEDLRRLAVFWSPVLGMKAERILHLAKEAD